ncbi:MAG TPA: DUF4870 domain-containing protein [Terriglobales bacterium]|nr:DUF4870 domain-containing protein [Terriglobales bacterium]
MAYCSSCGMQIAEGSTMCPACSAKASAGAAARQTGGLTDNVAGLLAYITIIPSIVFLVVEPYNKNRFIRFHSFQNLFFFLAIIILQIGLSVLGVVPGLIFITLPLHGVVWLGSVVVWVILLIKAGQGQMFKLPIIGDMAEKQANAM